jgi:hypothetical protein
VKPGLRLLVETENEALMITGKLFGQRLDGYITFQFEVAGPIHFAHPPLAEKRRYFHMSLGASELTDPRDFFDPTPGQRNVVLIKFRNSSAQRMIAGCEACNENAELPFDNILDRLTRSDPSGSSELH